MSRGWSARDWLGCSLILALGLLERAAPGGLLAFLAAIVILLLGEVPPRKRLGELASVLSVVAGAVAALLTLAHALGVDAPPVLATFARLVCLGSATLLASTPPARLGFHILAVAVALWTATALAPSPSPPVLILTLTTIAGAAQALAATHARALVAGAEASLVTGLPPGPREQRPPLLPGLVVAALGVLPFALGWDLPRPPGLSSRLHSPRTLSSAPNTGGGSGARRVEFEPELGFDVPRDSLEGDAAVVARVAVSPPSSTLLLRGAALDRATPQGFFPGAARLPTPPLLQPFLRRLDVELLRQQRGYLFATGRPLSIRGLVPRQRPGGLGVPVGARYPLRYQVECEVLHPRFFVSGLPALPLDPILLEVPVSAEARALLLTLAREGAGDAGTDEPAQAARNLERWLRQRCDYDTGQPLVGSRLETVLVAFLTRTRRGVCVEFSAAMTALLRLLGIPARVASGYRTDEVDAEGRFVVRARHAHAWVEVPFEGAGWVPFDPTPAAPGHVPFGEAAPPATDAEAGAAPAPPTPQPGDAGDASADAPQLSASPWLLLLAGLALAGSIVGGVVARRRLQREVLLNSLEGSAPPEALRSAREHLFAALTARGYRLGRSETPRAFARERLARHDPLALAVEQYTTLRFSGRVDPAAQATLHALLNQATAS
jgi:transglutaminase-like putative cysteine protease